MTPGWDPRIDAYWYPVGFYAAIAAAEPDNTDDDEEGHDEPTA